MYVLILCKNLNAIKRGGSGRQYEKVFNLCPALEYIDLYGLLPACLLCDAAVVVQMHMNLCHENYVTESLKDFSTEMGFVGALIKVGCGPANSPLNDLTLI